jgi:hypothetical protein
MGTCQRVADCQDGVSTATSSGATGCQTAGSDVFCCTRPPCLARGVNGVCSETSKPCSFSRVSSSAGASGCITYPTNVNCCPQSEPPPPTGGGASTPTPSGGGVASQPGDPCTTKGVSGQCQPPAECTGLSAATSDGGGCNGGVLHCCTQHTCSFKDPFGILEDATGQCHNRRLQPPCTTKLETSIGGATGCGSFNSDILCCLDNVPNRRAMPETPMPMVLSAPAPSPEIAAPPATDCLFFGVKGTCTVSNDCTGVPLVQAQGATGCTFSVVGTVCCIEKPCTVTDSKGARDGNCREKRRCQDDSLASFGLDEGAAGCEMFDVGTGCCAAPAEGANPGGGDPAPIDPSSQGLTETVCSVPFNGVQRAGTCVTPDNCMGGDWAPRTAPGFMGCRNAPQFNDRGCCTAKRTDTGPLPTVCKIGDAATCPFGEICVDVNGAPTCIVDRNFDCKAAGNCIIGGQECAPDGPNGAHVCGAARTCRVIPCQRADAKCLADASGLAQCVLANDCFRNPCSFDQVCRPDPRGTRFPSVCAPKIMMQQATEKAVTPDKSDSLTDQGWFLPVIITAAILCCLIIVCIVIAVIVALRSRTSYDYDDSGRDNTAMHMMNPVFGGAPMNQGAGYQQTSANYGAGG